MVSVMAKAAAVGLGLVLLLSLAGVGMAFESVEEGEVKVVKDKGAVTGEVFEPGWHWRTPISESTASVDTRPQAEHWVSEEDRIYVLTQDGQDVWVELTLQYQVHDDDALQFYKTYPFDNPHKAAMKRNIEPTVRSTLRDEGSDMGARQIITKDGRQTLEDETAAAIREAVNGTGITVNEVNVRDVKLNEQFSNELEAIEVENAKAEQRVIAAEADAKAEVARAEGDREAYEIRAEALKDNPEVLVEAYIKALDETDTVYVPVDGEGLPTFLDVSSEGNATAEAEGGG